MHVLFGSYAYVFSVVLFFFQAEDGIRDSSVTGVQTCALPIYRHSLVLLAWYRAFHPGVDEGVTVEQYFTGGMIWRGWPFALESAALSSSEGRSEERRVGKSVDLGGRRIIKKKKEGERWSELYR